VTDDRLDDAGLERVLSQPAGGVDRLNDDVVREGSRLGSDRPAALAKRTTLAEHLIANDQWEEAATHLAVLEEESIRILGAEHPATLETRNDYAVCIGMLGDHVEAARRLGPIAVSLDRLLGFDHLDTLTVHQNWAISLARAERWNVARRELTRVIRARKRLQAFDHPDTLTSRYWLANVICADGNPWKGYRMLRDVLTDQTRVLGPDHHLTKQTEQALREFWERQ
jgi:hypothetical protein